MRDLLINSWSRMYNCPAVTSHDWRSNQVH